MIICGLKSPHWLQPSEQSAGLEVGAGSQIGGYESCLGRRALALGRASDS